MGQPKIENRVPAEKPKATAERQKSYTKPCLEVLGDVRDLTLGSPPGTGDSADPINLQSQ